MPDPCRSGPHLAAERAHIKQDVHHVNRGGSQDFIKKYPKNTDISPILGIKFSTKIVQKGYDFIFFSLKESFSLVL